MEEADCSVVTVVRERKSTGIADSTSDSAVRTSSREQQQRQQQLTRFSMQHACTKEGRTAAAAGDSDNHSSTC